MSNTLSSSNTEEVLKWLRAAHDTVVVVDSLVKAGKKTVSYLKSIWGDKGEDSFNYKY